MNILFKTFLALGCLAVLVACSSQTPRPETLQEVQSVVGKDQLQGQIVGNVAANSRFAKLQIGMSRADVEHLIGVPTDIGVQTSGTAWVPYYFGSDNWRTENYYKGEGRLVFDTNSRLVLIDVSENARK